MSDESVSHESDALLELNEALEAVPEPVVAETGDVTGLVTRVASHPSDKSISILLVEVAVDSVGKGPIIISTP